MRRFAIVLPFVTLYLPPSRCMAADAGEFTMEVAPGGALRIQVGEDRWLIASAWSHPGEKIGWNRLSDESGEGIWRVHVNRGDDGAYELKADGAHYALHRQIHAAGGRIRIRDRLTNTGGQDVGILLDHTITGTSLSDIRICGGSGESGIFAENPTVFLKQPHSALAAIAEDNVFRTQFHALRQKGGASLGLRHLGLAPGRSVTLEWSIYPFRGPAGYFDFINRVRSEWNVNAPLPGPAEWMDVTRPEVRSMLEDEGKLRAFLDRTGLKMILLVPWLDYDNINRLTDEPTTRQEYKRFMSEAAGRIKAIDREIKLLGCIEAPFVSLPRDLVQELVALIPEPRKSGYHDMTDDMLAAFKANPQAWKRWGDSVVWARGGKAHYEYYIRGTRQQVEMLALTVRPVLGNGQHAYLMDQARFIVEEVGLDGFYVDSFTGAQHWHYGYSYDKWDGVTVDVDAATGKITDRYTDMALAGVGSRKELIEYGLSHGKTVVLNGHPIDRETQKLRAIFNESEWVFEPLKWMEKEPPLEQRPCEAHLSSPIALGFRPNRSGDEGIARYAEVIMKGAIAYLRHGITYFHYQTQIPESGPGSGEYGPFKHMFPITPVRLGEGFIEGKERIVSSISRKFDRAGAAKPRILLFDMTGRAVEHAMQPEKTSDGWRIDLKLADWKNIAVIE